MSNYCDALKSNVLNWLETSKISGSCCRYRFSAFTDDTIFCTCFALFILGLFKETKQFSDNERKQWKSYIQGFQNERYGYFEPKKYYNRDKERNRYQLTCFCLSALGILGAEPRFPLNFLERWKTPDDVKRYLCEKGCHLGKPGSGNKAMFLAIFLIYEYERTGESHFLDKINAWFEFHDKTQNSNGFWGNNGRSHFFHGLQNGFHQLLVYFYWNRSINKLDKIVDVALKIQDREGYFSPVPGGEACHDYDAIHILANAHNVLDYKRREIAQSLERAFVALLQNQNDDGGFCQSKEKPNSIIDLMKSVPFCVYGTTPYIWYYRLRRVTGTVVKKDAAIHTGWTQKKRKWHESNLWDTWFRCLALAEIANTIDLRNDVGLKKTNFHKIIGLGYFKNQH